MSDKPSKIVELPLPVPLYTDDYKYQGGITDPAWPSSYEEALGTKELSQLEDRPVRTEVIAGQDGAEEESIRDRYSYEYSGRIARQDFLTIMRANILAADRAELKLVLQALSEFIVEEITESPSHNHVGVLEKVPNSYRVTITLGFGSRLFVDQNGVDRYGLSASKPRWLKTMPAFPGDAPNFRTADRATDIVLLICSDHPYVNTAITRYFSEYFNYKFSKQHHGEQPRQVLKFLDVEQGFGRKDKREFLRFDDGIQNLQMDPDEMRRLVYVDDVDNEPDWCTNGSYLVYRKITENMPIWERIPDKQQEQMIGRFKETGKPVSGKGAGAGGLTPVFTSHTDAADGDLNSHIRKVQPRRNTLDLFGLDDLDRRFLRRPYPFFDGIDADGRSTNGLHFIAFMKSIQQQFEHVTNMWQMNDNFPVPDTGKDILYQSGVLSTIDGGYYFCPPGLEAEGDFFGSGMFHD